MKLIDTQNLVTPKSDEKIFFGKYSSFQRYDNPTVVPNFRVNNRYYKRAFECDQYALLKNAAQRQKWIDQSQSVNVYISTHWQSQGNVRLAYLRFAMGSKRTII